jgi:hypothetical protein
MSKDYNRFRILYYLYDKHYNMQFGWQDKLSMRMAEDLKYISEKSFLAETIYLQMKGFIEGNFSDVYPSKVRISAEGIDVIDQIIDKYMKSLSTMIVDGSKYQYRHLSAIIDTGDDNAVRSQLYYYTKQREAFESQWRSRLLIIIML